MLKNLSVPGRDVEENLPRIKVLGVGGAGGNAIDNMIGNGMSGVEFLICNTDAQALLKSVCEHRLQLGEEETKGLGAGSSPQIGRKAAEENQDEIRAFLQDAQMVFLAAGMGGGTGTGSSPVIARIAKELGILTVAVVTTPFAFEGKQRRQLAECGVMELEGIVDTISVINNQNLFRISSDSTKMQEAFATADEVLASSVRSITDLVTRPGVINSDFADVRTVMANGGRALISTVETEGEGRAERAAEAVVLNPLLEKVDIATAQKLLIQVVGSEDLKLFEVQEIVDRIGQSIEGDHSVAFGYSLDKELVGRLRVSVVATGIENPDEEKNDAARDDGRAAMWFDTHQRARRKEHENASEEEQMHSGFENNVERHSNMRLEQEENSRQKTSVDDKVASKGNGKANRNTPIISRRENSAFRNELNNRMSGQILVKNAEETQTALRGRQDASNSVGNSGAKERKKPSHKNIGGAQSILEVMKNFLGIKGDSLPPSAPVYLPRYEAETSSLPFEQSIDTQNAYQSAKQSNTPHSRNSNGQHSAQPNGQPMAIPAFLRRQKN